MEIKMYLFFILIFLLLLIFFLIGFFRRKKIIKKICSMCANEKCALLNELLEPFGYSCCRNSDVITSRVDAWQKDYGYTSVYDKFAYRLHIIFDCLPIYFDYNGRTWLIEFWKGQYGMCAGCEVGVYYTNRIIEENERDKTMFFAVSEPEMPLISFQLCEDDVQIADMEGRHWWLTAFLPGRFTNPHSLSMHTTITFVNKCLAESFAKGLADSGYCCHDICVCHTSVSFCMSGAFCEPAGFKKNIVRLIQWMNRMTCRLYLAVTKPFTHTYDRILYLYYFVPRAFRKALNIRKQKKGVNKFL